MRKVLQHRFDMGAWFKHHGLPLDRIVAEAAEAASKERAANTASRLPCTPSPAPAEAAAGAATTAGEVSGAAATAQQQQQPQQVVVVPQGPAVVDWLLLSDFDKTLIDFDAGACVCVCMLVLCALPV